MAQAMMPDVLTDDEIARFDSGAMPDTLTDADMAQFESTPVASAMPDTLTDEDIAKAELGTFTPAPAESTRQAIQPPQTSEMPLLPMTSAEQQEFDTWQQQRGFVRPPTTEEQVSTALEKPYAEKNVMPPPTGSRVAAVVGGALPEALPESMRFPEAQAAHPGFAALGKGGSLVAQSILGGGLLQSTKLFRTGMATLKTIKSTPIRIAAIKGLDAIKRGVAGGAVSAADQYAAVGKGKQTFEDATKNVSSMIAANVASVLPEGVSRLLPTGTKIAGEILAQVGSGATFNYLLDEAAGRTYTEEEKVNIAGIEIPKQYLWDALINAGFAFMDIDTKQFVYAPKAGQNIQVGATGELGNKLMAFTRPVKPIAGVEKPAEFETVWFKQIKTKSPQTGEDLTETIKTVEGEPGAFPVRFAKRPGISETEAAKLPTEIPKEEKVEVPGYYKEDEEPIEQATPVQAPQIKADFTIAEQGKPPIIKQIGIPSQTKTTVDEPELFKTGQQEEPSEERGSVLIPLGSGKVSFEKPMSRFVKGVKRWFSSRGMLPDETFQAKVTKDGQINNYLRDIDKTVIKFRQQTKKAYGKARLPDDVAFKIDAALKGESDIESLPAKLQPIVHDMRTQIDALSQKGIDEGLFSGDLVAVISKNIGFYATRSYRVFDDPKWADKVPQEVRNNAKALLREEAAARSETIFDKIQGRLENLQAKKVAIQEKQLTPPLETVDEGVLIARKTVDETLDKSELQIQSGFKKIAQEIESRRNELNNQIKNINEEKTRIWRAPPVKADERAALLRREKALTKKLKNYEDKLDELDIDKNEALSLMDELQGELAETMRRVRINPTTIPDVGTSMAALNNKLNNLAASITKMGFEKGHRAERLINGIQKQTFDLVGKINESKSKLWSAPQEDVMLGAKSQQEQIAEIDKRIDELAALAPKIEKIGKPTEDEINGQIDNLLYKDGAPVSIMASGSKLGSKNLSMLKHRKEIPPQIRALWGEYKNADVNYARSVYKMASALANHQFLKTVLTQGQGKYFFDEPIVKDGESYSVKLAADQSSAMAPLNGKFTTKEIKDAFERVVQREVLPGYLKLVLKTIGTVKYAKTIGSVMTHIRNTTGNVSFAIANGHWHFGELPKAFAATFGDVFNIAPESLEGEIKDLIKRGVLSDGARSGELKGIIKDATQGDVDVLIGTGKKQAVQRTLKFFEKMYGAEDDLWKWYGFRNELARYKKALPNMPEEELRNHVATIIRDTYPTYSMVPEAIQKLRRFPLVGTFVSFPAEVIRTATNTIKLIGKELSDPKLKNIGAQRLVGAITAATLASAIGIASRHLTGTSRKKEEAQREFLPPWSKNSTIVHTGTGGKLKEHYIDLGYTDPYSYLKDPIIAFMRGEDWQKRIILSSAQFFEPFLSEDLFWQKITDLQRNKTATGQPVYNPQDDPSGIATDIALHFAEAFEPGTVSGARRMYQATQGKEGKAGTAYDLPTELMAQTTGVRVSKMDIPRSLRYKAFQFSEELKNAGMLAAKKNLQVSERGTLRSYDKFRKTIDAAYMLGMSKNQIAPILLNSGLPMDVVGTLIEGTYPEYIKATTKAKGGRIVAAKAKREAITKHVLEGNE